MVFNELMKRTDSTQHEPFSLFKYAWQGIAEVAKGVILGKYIGRGEGPVGSVVGAGALGGGAGAIACATASGADMALIIKKLKERSI